MKKMFLLFTTLLLAVAAGIFLYKKDIVIQVQERAKRHTDQDLKNLITGYKEFRQKYAEGNESIMQQLSVHGQKPQTMMIACSDSRVDPAVILQTDPGDIFMVRNVANIVPPYEKDAGYHGTSSALEYGIRFLEVKNLIILGHSQCGGVQAAMQENNPKDNDFIGSWVSLIRMDTDTKDPDKYAQQALKKSYENCMTFPWIKERVEKKELSIHLWFFDIKTGQISAYDDESKAFRPLDA